jgi:predicted negative regulator of RcsB-dependent stress response
LEKFWWSKRAQVADGADVDGVQTMNRNGLYLLVGALAAAAMVLGYLFYQERQKTSGIDVSLGDKHISIETK